MSTKLTISDMADLIIIITFFSIGFTAFMYLFIDSLQDIARWVRALRKARKERKAQKLKDREQDQTDEPEQTEEQGQTAE